MLLERVSRSINDKYHSGISADSSPKQVWQGSPWPLEEIIALLLSVSFEICACSLSFCQCLSDFPRTAERKMMSNLPPWILSFANNYSIHSLFHSTYVCWVPTMYWARCFRLWVIQWWVGKTNVICLYGGSQSRVKCVKEAFVLFLSH